MEIMSQATYEGLQVIRVSRGPCGGLKVVFPHCNEASSLYDLVTHSYSNLQMGWILISKNNQHQGCAATINWLVICRDGISVELQPISDILCQSISDIFDWPLWYPIFQICRCLISDILKFAVTIRYGIRYLTNCRYLSISDILENRYAIPGDMDGQNKKHFKTFQITPRTNGE